MFSDILQRSRNFGANFYSVEMATSKSVSI